MFNELNAMNRILLIIIGCLNVFSLSLYYIDKQRAINKKYRISEKTLLIYSFALGGVGAWLGMKTFRHKTKHARFKFGLPVAALITLVVLFALLSQNISALF